MYSVDQQFSSDALMMRTFQNVEKILCFFSFKLIMLDGSERSFWWISDDCLVFTDKATGRGSSTVVGTVVDMKQCVAMVKREFPEARGASMDHPLLDLPEFNCYAHLDHMDNIYSNAKYTVCWLTSPLSTKYTYCKHMLIIQAQN